MSVKFKATQKLNDARARQIKAAIERFRGSYVSVGVHLDAGEYENTGREDAPSVAKVAWWLENGTQNMPARPFFYPTLRHYEGKIARMKAEGYAAVAFSGGTVEHALARQGFAVQNWVQNTIKSNVPPPLSEAYLARRRLLYPEQGSRTLIASGLLLRSVRYKVSIRGGDPVQGPASGPEPEPAAQQHGKTHAEGAQEGEQARALGREIARQQGAEKLARQKLQKAEARAHPQEHASRFMAQRRAYVSKPRGKRT